jgi:hypothetical protein
LDLPTYGLEFSHTNVVNLTLCSVMKVLLLLSHSHVLLFFPIATLPALFFAAVMSENTETGKTLFGNDVYITANRKNAKIKFPIESSSKMCQVLTLENYAES